MSFEATPGRMLVKDGSHVVLDTDEELFHGTDFKTGSRSIPERSATTVGSTVNAHNGTYTHTLSSVNSDADTVLGSFRITTNTGQGVADLGWFSAGGTYIHYYDATTFFGQPSGTKNRVNRAHMFTFTAGGGSLKLNERVLISADAVGEGITTTLRIFAMTIEYKLYVGTFT
jgi:hypothetical protein